MSDSDEDLEQNNCLQYNSRNANPNRTNFNNTNMSNYAFRNNVMTSTFNTGGMQRQRYGMQGFDQLSMCYRRESSPISVRSFHSTGMQNYHNSYYGRGMSSTQRSVFNGRSGSPVSMRSIDSNASVSAADIAQAFKNVKFNKYDLRLIKDAYNKFLKNRVRKRVEKRRNLKLFLKGNRRKSGDDSGEQGSNSSMSSDDYRSTRSTGTAYYKENLPKSQIVRKDLSNFRNTIKESNMYTDCTENIKHNSLRNMFANNSTSYKPTLNNIAENKSTASSTLKDRFTKGASFLLPSQRFNKSIDKLHTNKTLQNHTNHIDKNSQCQKVNSSHETDSDKEEIFAEVTIREKRKRVLDTGENHCSEKKKKKLDISPIKPNDTDNDFIFKKPQMPIKKSLNPKRDVPEIVIAKSQQTLTESFDLDLPISSNKITSLEYSQTSRIDIPQNSTEVDIIQKDITQNSDVSMRPSFIKRKLFTQKLDVAEKKNTSTDSLGVNSPQTKLYSQCGEKNKVRKLVTSQSCLSRDVLGDDNLLELIHKIVPPDQMNITNATNMKDSEKHNRDSNDRWDVASVISMCNDNEGSDTYTDEEIFKAPLNTTKKSNNVKEVSKTIEKPVKTIEVVTTKEVEAKKLKTQCKVVVEKLQSKVIDLVLDQNRFEKPKSQNKRTVSSCVKSFWDTDFESDMEDRSGMSWKSKHQALQANDVRKDATYASSTFNLPNKRNETKCTLLSVRSFHNKAQNSNKSDISRVSKLKEHNNNLEVKENNANTQKTIPTTKQLEDKEIQKAETQNSKKNTKTSENKKSKNEKPEPSKKTKNNARDKNKLNSSRKSPRLKEKKEKENLLANEITSQRGRPIKKISEKSNNTTQKQTSHTHKSRKETSNKTIKVKNPSIKNATLNQTKNTPRKCNEIKSLSILTDSSMNTSNISSRSLRVRRPVVK